MSRATLKRLFGYAPPAALTIGYAIPGGTLTVDFDGNESVSFGTENVQDRTRDGIGVGERIPLGPCHRFGSTSCQHRWRSFAYFPVDRQGTPGQWLGFFCHDGIHEEVRLGVAAGAVNYISMWYEAGVCGRRTPRQPLTARDRTAIEVASQGHVSSTDTSFSAFRVSVDGKRWASVWLAGRTRSVQPAFAGLEHRAGRWTVVDLGTRDVGCGTVPIKPLTQIGGGCSTWTSAP